MSDRTKFPLRIVGALAGVLLLLAAPLSLESFWLQTGLFAMAAVIGAVGLTLLVGVTGQLSLGHAFFVAVGAYGYAFLAGSSDGDVVGVGLPPAVATVGAVVLAGVAGALFSPIAGRLRGIYLGLASLGLVFAGQHILQNATAVTGGFNGRDAAPFRLFDFSFTATDPELIIFNVPYGALERLWYLGLLLVAVAVWYARNLLRGRPGRALVGVRDSEAAAAVMGVNVRRYKAAAFTVSSAYAGLAGVLLALAFGRIVPESFGFLLSVDLLAMIIIGGLGSIGGAAAGAVFVIALPLVLNHYSDALPFLAQPGEAGIGAAEAARLLYGAAILAVLLYLPGGLAQLTHRISAKESRHEQTTAGNGDSTSPHVDRV
ncbi:branched-chain amino acid ABC transporter permease [Actinophytocola sp.]|uniref:branched-chain amino acid ABC transporter permease n=1 Tax=Actinophytocola sp. TaxID=1872138 RepID=UPI002ED1233C